MKYININVSLCQLHVRVRASVRMCEYMCAHAHAYIDCDYANSAIQLHILKTVIRSLIFIYMSLLKASKRTEKYIAKS